MDPAQQLIEALVRTVARMGSYTDPGILRVVVCDLVSEFELDGAAIWRMQDDELKCACREGDAIDLAFARSATDACRDEGDRVAWPLWLDGRTLGVLAIRGSISAPKRLLAGMLAGRCAHILSDAQRAGMQRTLLDGLSHELRAPLQALLGHVDLLRAGTFGPLTADQAEAMATVSASAERILGVARDVLQVSRIEAGHEKVIVGEVAVDELLAREVEAVRPMTDAAGLTLEIECPEGLTLVSDGAKLGRILTNLLSNAVKYTPEGGIRVRAGPGFIEVTDTGVGIPPEQRKEVFKEYVRLDDARDGTGLGLAIVRRLAALISARIVLRSKVGVGTTMRIELP